MATAPAPMSSSSTPPATRLGSFFDPSSGAVAGRPVILGDGRIELTYDNTLADGVTTQYQNDIFDLRTAGLNIHDSGLNDGKDKYIAGTQFSDTFTGENNVNNTYYYVGSAAGGTAPTDNFTGGGGTAWNVAILPDAASNYTVTNTLTTLSSFTTLASPYTNTQPHGINDLGQIVGNASASSGFFYSGGTWTLLNDPSATISTQAEGINNEGQIVGYYYNGGAYNNAFIYSGGTSGTYTTLGVPNSFGANANAINDLGQIVGAYADSNGNHGFLDIAGTYTTLNDPNASQGTFANGINNLGQIVGNYLDASGASHGFLYSGGVYTTIDDPLASGGSPGAEGTYAQGINNAGQIVGYYWVGSAEYGFLYSNGTFTTLNDLSATNGTYATAINNVNEIVGTFNNSVANGFTVSASGTTSLTNANDPLHHGTLNLTGVQEAVFNPSTDPSGNSGLFEAFAGSTVVVLGPLTNISEPAQIDSGATLEFNTPASGTVTFAAGATGTLILEQPATFTGTIAGLAAGDVIDLVDLPATSTTIGNSQLTVKNGSSIVDAFNISNLQSGDVVVAGGDGHGGTDLTIEPAAYLWSSITYPAVTGAHLYGPFVTTPSGSSNSALLATLYGDTSSSYSDTGPDTITTNLVTSDPFGLLYASSLQQEPLPGQTVPNSTTTFPANDFPRSARQLLLVSTSATNSEGIGFYVSENGSGTAAINQFTFNEGTTGLNTSTPPSITTLSPIESGLTGPGLEFFTNFTNNTTNGLFNNTNAAGASYGIAWAQLNGTTFTGDFQLFTPGGTAEFATPIQLFNDTGVTGTITEPAWFFRSAGTVGNSASTTTGSISGTTLTVAGTPTGLIEIGQTISGSGIAGSPTITAYGTGTGGAGTYTLSASQGIVNSESMTLKGSDALYGTAIAEINGVTGIDANAPSNSDFIQFQAYRAVAVGNNAAGADLGPSFQITPNISAYGSGATDAIDEETGSGNHTASSLALQFAPNSGASSGYSLAWNEVVTDSSGGTHDQVEFAIYNAVSGLANHLETQQVFQTDGNAQNVRLTTTNINGANVAILSYGDNTGTHVIEFNSGSASVTGSILGSTLTVTGVSAGSLAVGDVVIGTGIAANTTIAALGSGTGGTGTYTLSASLGTVNSEGITIAGGGGNQIASFVDPSTTTFGQLVLMGDGRIALTYDNTLADGVTTQYKTDIYDLRTAGLNINDTNSFTGTISGTTLTVSGVSNGGIAIGDAVTGVGVAPGTTIAAFGNGSGGNGTYTLSGSLQTVASEAMNFNDGKDKYVAGTQFSDTFVGENNVNNSYYYVGANTTAGTGPTDSFTGGGGTAWNVAIMPDAPSNYTINTNNGVTTLVNIGDPAHAGTLNLTNVQAVAFAPTVDPSGNPGTLTATGGGLLVLGPLPNGSEPVTIDSGSILGLQTPEAGTVTFAGSGTLILDNPASFTGQIAGLEVGDTIDLAGTQAQSTTISGSTLTVTETNGGPTLTFNVSGALTNTDVVVHGDGYGGSDSVISPAGYLWGTDAYPFPVTTGEHLFFASETINASLGVGALLYGETRPTE